MKGWKTFLVFLGVSLLGWATQFIDGLQQAITTCQTVPTGELCSVGFPAWTVGVLGMVGMGLRLITTTPVFKK